MKNKDKLKLGFTACYQKDYGIRCLIEEIPISVAIAWARNIMPPKFVIGDTETDMIENLFPHNAATGGGWLNKRFIIIGESNGRWLSISNHDGRFTVGIASL